MQGEDPTVLLAAAARGDTAAWDAIVDRFSGLVWAVARSHRLSGADAADVSQTTWLRLVEHLDRIEHPERIGAWLATTARRESLAAIRRGSRHVSVGGIDELVDPSLDEPSPEDPLVRAEERSAVAAALGRLAERCQRLLRLLMADPPPRYDELAAALGIPIGSIGPTRSRCLERLQRELEIAGI